MVIVFKNVVGNRRFQRKKEKKNLTTIITTF